MRIHVPVPPAETEQIRVVSRLARGDRPRLLVLNSGRAAGQPFLETLLSSLQQTGLYRVIDSQLIPSGANLDQVTDAARQYDATVIGVAD
ncbi:MAG: hypothetical protein M1136_10680 [Chloroflexi bacterium]|nr:hypothetical protein [Chloroflexota bacterium]MCL5076091.1 hypothetical protein [Chloroflexota bacterium]